MTDRMPLPNRKPTAAVPLGRRRPATAHRSAATNDPLIGRANGNTARGRRLRDLYRGLIARLGNDPDVVVQADALEVAELMVACEDIRADLAGKPLQANEVNALTRLQSTAARAKRSLLKSAPAKPKGSALAEYLAIKHGTKPNA